MKNFFWFTIAFLTIAFSSSAEEYKAWNINDMVQPKFRECIMAKSERIITTESLPELRKALTIPAESLPKNERVDVRNVITDSGLRIRIYTPKKDKETKREYAGLLWIHGGGHIMGTPEGNEDLSLRIADELECIVVSPAYRLTPENPYPADLDDCYEALLWMTENLPLRKDKIAVAGQSAGGGLAAAVALLARDRKGPALCFQMLLYPMIDYRNVTASSHQIQDRRAWCREFNIFAWELYLANVKDNVPVYASPSIAEDLSGLPPAYVMACELDPLRDEDIDYAQRLMEAGIAVELHVYQGVTHGFEAIFPESELSRKAETEYVNALAEALR